MVAHVNNFVECVFLVVGILTSAHLNNHDYTCINREHVQATAGEDFELAVDAHLTGTVCPPAASQFPSSSEDNFFNQYNLPSDSTTFEVVFGHQPPPYRAPPSASAGGNNPDTDRDCCNSGGFIEDSASPPESTKTYQTHSAKFPIVKEVIFSASSSQAQTQTLQRPPNLNKGPGQLTNGNSRIPVWTTTPGGPSPDNKKLSSKPQLGWPEDRKAFTLDSRSAKEFQEKFQSGSQSQRIVQTHRRNSLDLEKFIQVFNEEQALLASMQGRHLDGGIDNPGLDLGGVAAHSSNSSPAHHQHQHQHNHQHSSANPAAMYNGGATAAASGKLSGYFPTDSSNSSQSQSLSSSNTDSLDTVIYKGPSGQQGAGSVRDWQQRSSESNPELPLDFNHRGENNSHRDANNHMAYQMQQVPYQHMSPHYNGQNYSIDYRSTQPGQQQYQQHLQQQQQGLSVQSLQHPHQTLASHHHQNNNSNGLPHSGMNGMMRGTGNVNHGYIGSNPQLPAKSPLLTQKQFTSTTNNQTLPPGADVLLLDKTKDSTKQFPTKTYNHIKDMISSRFGSVGGSANNNGSMSYNNNVSGTNSANMNGHANNSNSIYPNHNGGLDMNMGLPNSSYGIHHHHQNNTNGNNFVNGGSQNQSPATGAYYGQQSPNSASQNQGPYRNNDSAPAGMNGDRKNVNTSFRKAIQKSTQKSNLSEESVQLRTISEAQGQNQVNNSSSSQFHRSQPLQQYSPAEQGTGTGIHAVRAQKALDKLCESSKQYTGPISAPTGGYQLQQHHLLNGEKLSQAQNPPPYPDKAPPPVPPSSSRMAEFSIKSPLSLSPGKQSTLASYSKHSTEPAQTWNDNDQPPPLPMSQKPSQDSNTVSLGLPSPLVSGVRENGDGSSGSTEAALKSESALKSEKLKQMTTDLHNLALSVANEHQSSSSDGEIKGSQRVGSGQSHTTTDSGHGTVLLTKSPQHSGNTSEHAPLDGLIGHRHKFGDNIADSISSGNDSEWVDIVEPEIRQILELERAAKAASGKSSIRNASGNSQQFSSGQSQQLLSSTKNQGSAGIVGDTSASPVPHSSRQHILPQISPSAHSPKPLKKFDLNIYNKKLSQEGLLTEPSSGQDPSTSKTKSPRVPTNLLRTNSGSGQRAHPWNTRSRLANDKGKSATVGRKELLLSQTKAGKLTRNAMSQILYSLNDDNGDMTSTTTGLDLESMLDGPTENTSDDDDLSTTIDTTDAHAIRRQLESLESMYTEVLKVLGAKKFAAGSGSRYPSSDLRNAKRRPYGSMSSLPSSVSSRPFRESKKKIDDKKKVKDIKSINRRFQRLESHVVTLARSVAHLSSEMRTQHLMVQEMESIRNELSQLRSLTMKAQNQSAASAAVAASGQNRGNSSGGRQGGGTNAINSTDWTSFRNALPSLTNPCRVRKLTKFFGDEPPLIRIFLKKLGYEKYASVFEQERIGIMELPYLTEERLQKMGIPMGPRLRILQEAHLCLKPGSHFPPDHPIHNGHGNTGNLSVYVV